MAVNLLSLARASAAGLHNSGRGSGRSYAPGTSYGNKIAGTNIRQGAGMTNLASKGRTFGGVKDTKIRKVKGRAAHVNKREASVIDLLGPLGEAWVEKIGSGTINPQTGMKEYGLFKSNPFKRGGALSIDSASGGRAKRFSGAWKPSEGKWGVFGSTKASGERDAAKVKAAASHKMFETFRRKFENENIAGIFTEDIDDLSDDTPLTQPYAQDFENFIKTESGLEPETNDIADYTDEYDARGQDESLADTTRELDQMKLASEGLEAKTEGVASGLSSGLFGMLTQAQDTTATKGFAGSGDFAADFAKKTAIKEAEAQFGGVEREKESMEIDKEQIGADSITDVTNLQENYNQEFWNNMVSWDSAVNT